MEALCRENPGIVVMWRFEDSLILIRTSSSVFYSPSGRLLRASRVVGLLLMLTVLTKGRSPHLILDCHVEFWQSKIAIELVGLHPLQFVSIKHQHM